MEGTPDLACSLTELPYGLPGRIFRSPMPFRIGDLRGEIFDQFRDQSVAVVVLLAERGEYLAKTGKDLPLFYISEGLEVIHLPVPDFGVPHKGDLEVAIAETIAQAREGKNIAIHCYAGFGRTGLFAACLAKRVLGLSGDEAVAWVRKYIPGALEMPRQVEMARNF